MAKVEVLLADLAREMGIPSPYIVSTRERTAMIEQEAQSGEQQAAIWLPASALAGTGGV
ncbi:MAG: hypothetical protein U5K75_08570 [Ahrensia sp.]|nr:hypothetical protein [Ahrensia sp.]